MIKSNLKKKFLLKLLLITGLAGIAALSQAQDLQISAQLNPQQAVVGQQLRLVITIEGKANVRGNPELPALDDFQVYGGGRSSNFSFVNGQVSSALSFTYVLVPQKTGQFTIGPIKITHDNKIYSTNPIPLTVSSQSQSSGNQSYQAQTQSPSTSRQAPDATVSQSGNEPIFVTTSVDKKSVYVNEPLTLTFKFYRRIPLLSQPQYTPPATNGFWSEDLPPQKNYVTNIQGYDYEVTEINTALFPTAAGKLTIAPAHLIASIRGQSGRSTDPFGDDFFNSFFTRGRQVELKSKPITIDVKAVPVQNRPQDYTGTVGQWSMSAKLDRKTAKVGDPVTLEVRLFGEGNVKSVGKPKLPEMIGFKAYETVSSSEVQKQNNKVKGVKIYRTLIRPEIKGDLTIPEITYSYFDPRQGRFEHIQVPPLSLEVIAGQATADVQQPIGLVPQAVTGPGVKVIAKDIRYLKTDFTLSKAQSSWPIIVWAVCFIIPPIILVLVWMGQQHRLRLINDPRYARKLSADKTAKKIFKTARLARHKKDTKLFYTSLTSALTGYLADQLGYSRSGITQREILEQLRQLQADKDIITRLAGLFDECDFARFAKGEADPQAMEIHEQEAEKLLAALIKIVNQEKKV